MRFLLIFLIFSLHNVVESLQIDISGRNFTISNYYIAKMEYFPDTILSETGNNKISGCRINIKKNRTSKNCQGFELYNHKQFYNLIEKGSENVVELPHVWDHVKGNAIYSIDIISDLETTYLSNKNWMAHEAFRIWVLQEDILKFVGGTGVVTTKPSRMNVTGDGNFIYTIFNKKKPFKLIFEVSNHTRSRGGLGEPFLSDGSIFKKFNFYLWKEMIIFGILTFCGIYSLMFYYSFRKFKSAFWFGLFCITLSIRGLLVVRVFELLYDPVAIFFVRHTIEYLTVVVPALFFLYYVDRALLGAINKRVINIITFYCLGLVFYCISADPRGFADSLVFFQAAPLSVIVVVGYTIYKILRDSKRTILQTITKTILYTGVVLFGATIWDILSTLEFINYRGQFFSVGLLVFIVGQMFLLTAKSAHAFRENVELTQKLKTKMQSQEKRKEEIYNISKRIQDTKDFSNLWETFTDLLKENYDIKTMCFFVKEEQNSDILRSFKVLYTSEFPEDHRDFVKNMWIDISDSRSIHRKAITRGKPVYLNDRLTNPTMIQPNEVEIYQRLKVTGILIIPVYVGRTAFGAFTIIDSGHIKSKTIGGLDLQKRKELELFCSNISSFLYQTIQGLKLKAKNEELQDAYRDLELSEEKISRIQSESHLNTLAAYIAHEINNPLNYISTGAASIEIKMRSLKEMVYNAIPDSDEGKEFREELEEKWKKTETSMRIILEGFTKIKSIVEEVKEITSIDGVTIASFDAIALLKEEITFCKERANIPEFVDIYINNVEHDKFVPKLPYIANTGYELVKRALRSIISEAIYFTSTGEADGSVPEIRIETSVFFNSENEKMISISFSNNGRSIKNTKGIFDPKVNKGHGTELIGLPSVKQFITNINGNITLEDDGRESGWVKFDLWFPINYERRKNTLRVLPQ